MDLNQMSSAAARKGVRRPAARPAPSPLKPAAAPAPRPAPAKPVPAAAEEGAEGMDALDALLTPVIEAAMAVAFSDHLPADPPNVTRSLANRRRAYVQLAALHFVNYQPALREHDVAGVLALGLVHRLLSERDAAQRGAQATLPEPPAATQPNGHNGRPPAPAREMTVLEAAVEKLMRQMIAVGQDFREADVAKEPRLREAARMYLAHYGQAPGQSNHFVQSVAAQDPQRLSDAQIRGVLNCWKGDIKRADKAR